MARLKITGYVDLTPEQVADIWRTDATGEADDEIVSELTIDDLKDLDLVMII